MQRQPKSPPEHHHLDADLKHRAKTSLSGLDIQAPHMANPRPNLKKAAGQGGPTKEEEEKEKEARMEKAKIGKVR